MQMVSFPPGRPALSNRLDGPQSQNGVFSMDGNRLPVSGIEQIFFDLSSLDLPILSTDLFRLPRYPPPLHQSS